MIVVMTMIVPMLFVPMIMIVVVLMSMSNLARFQRGVPLPMVMVTMTRLVVRTGRVIRSR